MPCLPCNLCVTSQIFFLLCHGCVKFVQRETATAEHHAEPALPMFMREWSEYCSYNGDFKKFVCRSRLVSQPRVAGPHQKLIEPPILPAVTEEYKRSSGFVILCRYVGTKIDPQIALYESEISFSSDFM